MGATEDISYPRPMKSAGSWNGCSLLARSATVVGGAPKHRATGSMAMPAERVAALQSRLRRFSINRSSNLSSTAGTAAAIAERQLWRSNTEDTRIQELRSINFRSFTISGPTMKPAGWLQPNTGTGWRSPNVSVMLSWPGSGCEQWTSSAPVDREAAILLPLSLGVGPVAMKVEEGRNDLLQAVFAFPIVVLLQAFMLAGSNVL